MSAHFYLIRHGQAGTRTNYDTLSEKGRAQARLLGEALAAHGIEFTAAYCGGLERQRQTADAVCEAYGANFPPVVCDPGWREFDLDAVYRDIAPVLAARDPAFRAAYEEMLRQAADENHAVHRRWSSCDLAVARAWVEATVPTAAESWAAFQLRVGEAFRRLVQLSPESANVAVFTSATPVAICVADALGASSPQTRFQLAGALFNAAYAVLSTDGGLVSFNEAGHLVGEMRTLR
jgi:broad specificity phosphatase PhoE